MNLLGAILYDPSTAASIVTTTALAMTAFDTTNLRLTITPPSHGYVFFRLCTVIEGATTFPQVNLGVMNGASVVGRVTPQGAMEGTALATTRMGLMAEFTATGQSVTSTNYDAAYGVETGVASSAFKYGGPNNTTANDAWGGFVFEAWDPRPLTLAQGGAVTLTTSQTFNNTGTWTGNIVGTLSTCSTLTTYTGNTPQTGDAFARIGAAGVSLTNVGLTTSQTFNNTGTWTGNVIGTVSTVSMVTNVINRVTANADQIGGSTIASTNLMNTATSIARGTADTGGTVTSIPTSAFSIAPNSVDQFRNRIVIFDAGTATQALRGQQALISASTNAATPTLTVATLTAAPASGDTFSIV